MKKVFSHLPTPQLVLLATTLLSLIAIAYFMFSGNQNLGNYDAVARLNIARKITDSLTPGLGQLGGVWLPFPQILMTPFVRIDWLWYSGLAGSIVSGISFIFGAFFLYKTAFFLTKSTKASLLVWLMYVANVNILLLQTMALSETFFMTCLILVLYYLTRWIEKHELNHLLAAAFFVILITLTRYEGYFVFIGSIVVVIAESIRAYWHENWQKKEGMILLYVTVAGFGVAVWCVYCFLFYGDFLYWLHLYADGKQQVSTASQSVRDISAPVFAIKQNSLIDSFKIYSEMIMWMNGKITVFLGLFGFFMVLFIMSKKFLKKQRIHIYMPLVIISVVLFAFLVYGYQKGFIPEVKLPPQLIPELQRKSFTIYSDSNIRYGIILAPCIVLFAGLVAARNLFLYIVVIGLFALQVFINMYKPQVLQYSLPTLWPYSTVKGVDWFTSHYTRGLILISSNTHEDFVFQSHLPYKRFIYEGSREYWTESLNDPARYADWVIYDDAIQGDTVYYFLTEQARLELQESFDLVYDVNGFKVWHLRH